MDNYLRDVSIYTDGSYGSKSEFGGWGAIFIENHKIIDTLSGSNDGAKEKVTNNTMELTAFLTALNWANEIQTGHSKVTIYTDSAYISNCLNQGWYHSWMKNGWKTSDKQPVKNKDLWTEILTLYIKLKVRLDLSVIKVKGHKDNRYNNLVDNLAVTARKRLETERGIK